MIPPPPPYGFGGQFLDYVAHVLVTKDGSRYAVMVRLEILWTWPRLTQLYIQLYIYEI